MWGLATAWANPGGVVGASVTGCRPCHSTGADPDTHVTVSADPVVGPGELVTVVLAVETTAADRVVAGLDVTATGGQLVAGDGTRVVIDELTHSAPAALVGGQAAFAFSWRAPDDVGTWALRAAALTGDGDGTTSGDGWAVAPALTVRVDPACADGDGDGVRGCDGDCDDGDPAAVTCDSGPSDPPPPDREGCGCGPGGGGGALPALLAALAGLHFRVREQT